jgi:hypothetical protein
MFLSQLADDEQQVIHQCMKAIVGGRYLEGDIETRLGLDEDVYERIVDAFPHLDDSSDDSDVTLAINNSMNEVLHGFQMSSTEWAKWFNVSRDDVLKVYQKWARPRGWSHTGVR